MPTEPSPLPPLRFLFADDEPEIRKAFARTLRARGYIVDLASDGLEALELASEYPYAAVITDHQMPGLCGLELIRSLRGLQPDARYVLVTGLRDVENLARHTPGLAVLAKPWQDEDLFALLDGVSRSNSQPAVAGRSARSRSAGELVLLVEAHDLDAKVLESAIESGSEGRFGVVRAESIGEACRYLKARPYAVVVTDLHLPDAAGLSALTELRAVAPDAPIVVVTGADDEALGTEAVRLGAQDHLVKGSYDAEKVVGAILYAMEMKVGEQQLNKLAQYDPLTGLANRSLLQDRQERAMARSARSGKLTAMVLVDLDHFKAVNDAQGHDVGDRLLKEVARRLVGSTRMEDTVARTGGDEFAVLLEDLESADSARRVAQRILNAFATPFLNDRAQLPVTTSLGVAMYPKDASTLKELMRRADAALYEAKDSGRNTFCFFGEQLEARHSERVVVERDLMGALDAREYSIAYQPQFALRGGALRGYEALLRWDKGEGGPVPAREFLSVLDETGDIQRVGQWVLDSVCHCIAAYRGPRSVRFSVNVSARELTSHDFAESVERALARAGVEADRLVLEFSEQTLFDHLADARLKLARLAKLGIGVTIDDYGTGRSVLRELVELPITAVKLDPMLTMDTLGDRGRALLKAYLASASALGWEVCAKSVESEEQAGALSRLGFRAAQGRLWGIPSGPPSSAPPSSGSYAGRPRSSDPVGRGSGRDVGHGAAR